MDLLTLLRTSERRANTGYLVATWVVTLLAVASLTLINGWAKMQAWSLIQIGLFLLPSAMHLLRIRESWIKYYVAIAFPVSMVATAFFNPSPTINWPLWFLCLGTGAYYLEIIVVIESVVASFVSLAIALTVNPPQLLEGQSMASVVATGVLVMMILSFWSISASLRQRKIMTSLDQAAEMEEMTQSLNAAMARLGESAAAVQGASGTLADQGRLVGHAVTAKVLPALAALGNGFQDQSRSLAETVRAMDLLTATIGQLAQGASDQAQQVTDATNQVEAVSTALGRMVAVTESVSADAELSSKLAQEGTGLVKTTVHTAQQVERLVRQTAEHLADLGERSQKIGQVVVLIQEIANQTSMLSLNAAIEAARAGEQGRGFAVVAEEVRKLADRSARATHEISDLLGEVGKGVQASLAAMAQTTQSVGASAEQSEQTAQMLQTILEATHRTADRVREFHQQIGGVTTSAREISNRMSQLAALTEENHASAEEMTDASRRLNSEAHRVQQIQQQGVQHLAHVQEAVVDVQRALDQLNRTGDLLNSLAVGLTASAK